MNKNVRRAAYGKLAGDTTLNNLLHSPPTGYSKSIFYEQAPQGAQPPYVIFNKQAGTPIYGFGPGALNNDVLMVKAVDRSDDTDRVDDIASRLDELLTDSILSISGATSNYLRRESDIDYAEVADGITWRHSGSLFRLFYQP